MIAATGLLTTNTSGFAKTPMTQVQAWKNYEQKIVIDALCGGLGDLIGADTTKQANILTYIQSAGISAINETVTYPGADFNQATKDIANYLKLIHDMNQHISLIRSTKDILAAKEANKTMGVPTETQQ